MLQYVEKKFSMNTKSTIGSDFLSKRIEIEGKPVTLQIWDTAGQERFQSLGNSFYRGADGVIFVFDVSRRDTFEALSQWKQAFLVQAEIEGQKDFPMLVLANKIDRDDRQVTNKEAKEWCVSNGNIAYIETSAKEAVNVEKAFEYIAKVVVEKMPAEEMSYETVDLSTTQEPEKTCGC
eukprot:TRINITY_DN1198_c0_g1_i2.p1 TRINITY_DN1198_c0_g1~~TRINITY_DN1198_c0_g1_i2.p1  ORF type:complete len:178 (-),score=46.26 TRINITY_DN1198_c0_g1_i2:65-598(-)